MCFNMILYCPFPCRIEDGAIEIAVKKLAYNDDGFLVYATRGRKVIRYVRTLSIRQALATLVTLPPFTLLHIHFRAATSGRIDVDNVHGWKIGEFVVSHNGSVIEYLHSGVKSDSRMLVEDDVEFRKAVLGRKWEDVAKIVEDRRFYGVMFLTSPTEVYVIARCKSFYYELDDEGVVAMANDYIGGKPVEPAIYKLNTKTLSLEKLADTKCSYQYIHHYDYYEILYPKNYRIKEV